MPDDFLKQLYDARHRVQVVAILAVVLGVFALAYMLHMAVGGMNGMIAMAKLGFLAAGAIGVGIGLGLLTLSGGARSAGAVWFVAWGLINLTVGFVAALAHDPVMGIFALISGALHLFLAAAISSQDTVFVCDYLGGDFSLERIREAVRVAAVEGSSEMMIFLGNVISGAPPVVRQ